MTLHELLAALLLVACGVTGDAVVCDKCDCSRQKLCRLPEFVKYVKEVLVQERTLVILYTSECDGIVFALQRIHMTQVPILTIKLQLNNFNASSLWTVQTLRTLSERSSIYVISVCIKKSSLLKLFGLTSSDLSRMNWILVGNRNCEEKDTPGYYCERNIDLESCSDKSIKSMTPYDNVKFKKWWKRNALEGVTMKIGYLKSFPFLYEKSCSNSICELDGIDYRMVKAISDHYGFRVRYVLCPVQEWGAFINNSWVGLVGMVYSEKVDMAVGGLSETVHRSEGADFTFGYYLDPMTFAVRSPGVFPRAFVMFVALHLEIYLAVLSAALITSCVVKLLGQSFLDKIERLDFNNSLWLFLASLLMQGGTVSVPRNSAVRIIVASWQIFSIIMSTAFCAALVSTMHVPPEVNPVDTIQELVEHVKSKDFHCGTVIGTECEKFFESATRGEELEIAKSIWENPEMSLVPDYDAGISRVLSGRYAFVMPKTLLENGMYDIGFKHFTIARESFYTTSFSIAISKGSCLKEKFNKVIWTMAEAGIIWKWREDNMRHKMAQLESSVSKESEPFKVFELKDMQGIFVLLMLGYIISLLVLLIEIVCFIHGNRLSTKHRRYMK